MISIQKLVKYFGQKKVLKELDLVIEKGKIMAIIGPNGSGKSTLLSLVGRLIEKDSGQVLIDNQDIAAIANQKLATKLAVLRQANLINLNISVRDLVAFGRFPYSKGRLTQFDEEKINQVLDYLNLTELENNFITTLSGGQLQRAFIAMTLAQDTDYILLDEPLNNLDMKHSVQIMQLLRQLVQELDKTIIIVVHDINFAAAYADYIVALKNGRIVAQGDTDKMITEETLLAIYDMPIKIETYQGRKICNYFDPDTSNHCQTAHKLLNQ